MSSADVRGLSCITPVSDGASHGLVQQTGNVFKHFAAE